MPHSSLVPARLARFATLVLLLAAAMPVSSRADCPPDYVTKWGSRGSAAGQFSTPRAAVADGAGGIYVVDSGRNQVQFLTTAGAPVSAWGSFGTGPGQFKNPMGIARDVAGNIYVADTGNSRIQKFSSTGSWLATIGTPGSANGQLSNPQGVAVDGTGFIYVADTGNQRIQKFEADGSFNRWWGFGQSSVVTLVAVAVSASGIVATIDVRNGRVYSYTNVGVGLGNWGVDSQWNGSLQMAFDSQNRLHIPRLGYYCGIQVYDAGGTFVRNYGGNIDCVTASGGGVAFDGNDIYIPDTNRAHVYKFTNVPTCVAPPPPWASSEPKLLLHVGAVTSKNPCTAVSLPDCRSAVTHGALSTAAGPFHFVYLLATRGPLSSLQGLQAGISYDEDQPGSEADQAGIDVFGWTLCASLQFPTEGAHAWPQPGSGNLITWAQCEVGNLSVAGYFYVGAYSPALMRLTPRPNDGRAKVANCSSAETELTVGDLGSVEFSTSATLRDCNPCLRICEFGPVAVQPTTWSRIKTLATD